jgi:hypothetical protein
MWFDLIRFCSLFLSVLAMCTGFAHLLELPNKMGLPAGEYLVVQQIYRGWAWLGSVIFLAILSTLALAISARTRPHALFHAAIAFVAMLGTQIVFWTITFPVNQVTRNWTVLPDNWAYLRSQWEYSHAAAAALELVAVIALILLTLRSSDA